MCQFILRLQNRYKYTVDPYLTFKEMVPDYSKSTEFEGKDSRTEKLGNFVKLQVDKNYSQHDQLKYSLLCKIIPSSILNNDREPPKNQNSKPAKDFKKIINSSFLLWEYNSWKWWLYHAKTSPALLLAFSERYDESKKKGKGEKQSKVKKQNLLVDMILKTYKELDKMKTHQTSPWRKEFEALRGT